MNQNNKRKSNIDEKIAEKLAERIILLSTEGYNGKKAEKQEDIWELYKKKYVDSTQDSNEMVEFAEYFGMKYQQEKMSRLLKRLNIKKDGKIFYIKPKLPETNEQFIREWMMPEIIDMRFMNPKSKTVLMISVNQGKEAYVCGIIDKCFKHEKTSIIPAYGSVVLMGNKSEIADINNVISALKKKAE